MSTAVVIDDDRTIVHMVSKWLGDMNVDVHTAASAEEGLRLVAEKKPDLVLLDVMLPRTNGLDVFRQIQAADSKLPVIFITAGGDSETAIEAMKLGAMDYLIKPLDLARVREQVEQALEIRRLMQTPVHVPEDDGPRSADCLVGRSAAMQEVYKAVGRAAPQEVTVLIRGESGTGKELVARAIYQHSPRASGPFLAVNCAALSETLLESELFGHEKGAFTGADARRIGKFEQCSGGTIFLDEIGDMSPSVQSKVLRLLQEQKFERVGGTTTISTDVRIVCATNRDLEKMVADGEFREDLFFRINSFTIELPPLRDRGGDILLLIEHFLVLLSRKLGKSARGISPEALNLLTSYPWPGNVRELQSVIRQAILQTVGEVIIPSFLPKNVREGRAAAITGDGAAAFGGFDLARYIEERIDCDSSKLYAEALEQMERYLLTRVLTKVDGNQSSASKLLGITRGSLRHKLRALGISIEQVVNVGEDDEDDGAREEEAT